MEIKKKKIYMGDYRSKERPKTTSMSKERKLK